MIGDLGQAHLVSRRRFLRGGMITGAMIGSALVAACSQPAAAPATPAASAPASAAPQATSAPQATAAPKATAAPQASGPVYVVYATQNSDPPFSTNEQQVVNNFEDKNPQIRVQLEYWPGQNFYDKLRVLYAANQMPDTADMELKQLPDFVYRKMVQDITPLAQQADIKESDYWPRQWAKVHFQGKMWAFPLDSQDAVIFYNKDVFDQANVPYPPKNWDDPTWTWDKVLEISQKIAKGTGVSRTWGINVSTWWVYDYPFVWSWGGTVLNEQHTKSTLTMPETVAAFQFRADLINKYKVHPAAADVTEGVDHLFGANRLAMNVTLNTNAYVYKDVPNLKFDMAPMPAGKAGAWTRAPSDVIALGSQSKVLEQAFTFAHYLTGTDGLLLMDIQAGLGIPPLTSLANDFIKPKVKGVENLNWSMVLDIESKVKAKYQDVTIAWPEMDKLLTAENQVVLNGKETAQQMADKMSPQIDKLLAANPPTAQGWVGD